MIIILFFIGIWYASLFCQSFFQHRYSAHGAFKMSKSTEKFFFILSWITQGSSYMSPKAYAIMHRMHHAFTDTELDPHSPSYSKNVFDMMWRTRNIYRDIMTGKMVVEDRFTKNLPEWDSFDKFADGTISRVLWVLIYIAVFVMFATSPWQYLLLLPIFAMGAVHGAIINWYAHKYGYTSYKMKNTSHNLISVDFLMLGESYHNNHHKFPSAINFGKKWHEIDPLYPVIRFLGWTGIIKLPNLANQPPHSDNDF